MKNTKEAVAEFKGRLSIEVRQQKKMDKVENRDFRRGEMPEKYMAKILYR